MKLPVAAAAASAWPTTNGPNVCGHCPNSNSPQIETEFVEALFPSPWPCQSCCSFAALRSSMVMCVGGSVPNNDFNELLIG